MIAAVRLWCYTLTSTQEKKGQGKISNHSQCSTALFQEGGLRVTAQPKRASLVMHLSCATTSDCLTVLIERQRYFWLLSDF